MTWVVPKGFVIHVNQPPQFLQPMVVPQQKVFVVAQPRRVVIAQPQIIVARPRRVVIRNINWCRNGPGCRFRAVGVCQFRH